MKIDGVIVSCCFALVLVGVIFGINLNVENDVLIIINGFSTTLSALATLFAAIVALYGLNIWRNQYVFSERFKAFYELEEIAINALDLASRYNGIYWDEHSTLKTPPVYKNHKQERTSLSQEMRENICSYSRKVDYAKSLLTEKELTQFKYDFIDYERNVYELFQTLDKAYETDGQERSKLISEYHSNYIIFSKGIKKNLRSIRDS
ncbi:hypothetical protein ACROAE_18900 [Shewanella sp. MF05960]|uniref:hypothetical protein n=1 Tax=Shewanella sp. MF05960 TaxID=3434874 RepID=UPI003D7A74A7